VAPTNRNTWYPGIIHAESSGYLTHLRWRDWGSSRATATGIMCYHDARIPARVTAYRPRSVFSMRAYTRLRVATRYGRHTVAALGLRPLAGTVITPIALPPVMRALAATILIALGLVLAGGTPAHAATCAGGQPPITVSSRTSCALAAKVLNKWMNFGLTPRRYMKSRFISPVTHRSYAIACALHGAHSVRCSGRNGIWIRFEDWNR
jgi:hypothetical protein